MVVAGHVRDVREAFDRWLGGGLPGFIRRDGAPSEAVIEVIHQAGGLASIAHPGKSISDDRLFVLRDAGLVAAEPLPPAGRGRPRMGYRAVGEPDPYRWLEDASDPRTLTWLEQQAAAGNANAASYLLEFWP